MPDLQSHQYNSLKITPSSRPKTQASSTSPLLYYYLDVHLKDLLTTESVRPLDGHAAVEAAGPEECRIQDIHPG